MGMDTWINHLVRVCSEDMARIFRLHVAGLVSFLASESAGYITAQVICVDGSLI
jgi:NAD(P)-dependent dehydrogenase (short-subunit alcohol dehydrogenase family)